MRITKKDCEARIIAIRLHLEGEFYISSAYGGYSLREIYRPSTAEGDVLRCGHIPAKDLYHRINAFINGLEMRNRK